MSTRSRSKFLGGGHLDVIVDAGQHRDAVDPRLELAARDGLDPDDGVLSGLQPAAIGFVEPRLEVDRRQIRQLENRRAGPGAIALPELLLAAEHAAAIGSSAGR